MTIKKRSTPTNGTKHLLEVATQSLGLNPCQAAQAIPCSVGTVYNEIKALRLKARKLGRRTVILRSDLVAYLHSLPVKDGPSAEHVQRGHDRWAAAERRA